MGFMEEKMKIKSKLISEVVKLNERDGPTNVLQDLIIEEIVNGEIDKTLGQLIDLEIQNRIADCFVCLLSSYSFRNFPKFMEKIREKAKKEGDSHYIYEWKLN